jgi:hypothetical protein
MGGEKKMKNNNNWLVTVLIAIIVAGGAFYAGIQYKSSQTGVQVEQGGRQGMGMGQRTSNRSGGLGGAVIGDVVSMDTNSITVKMKDGSSKIVNISASTTYSKTDTASESDVKTGAKIAAFGTTNSDGSVTAQNIQLNPQISMRVGKNAQPTK